MLTGQGVFKRAIAYDGRQYMGGVLMSSNELEALAHARQREIAYEAERQRIVVLAVDSTSRRPGADRTLVLLGLLVALIAALMRPTPAVAEQLDQVLLTGGGRNDAGHGLAVDGAGNRYLTGTFQDTAAFGASRIRSRGADDAFVARVDAAGNLAWVQPIGGQLVDIGRSVALGTENSLFVTGQFGAVANFGPGVGLKSAGQGDGFLARYTRDGAIQWAVRFGGSTGDAGFAVAPLGSDVIVAGIFSGTATFTQADSSVGATLTSLGGNDIVVARYSATGRLVWAQRAGGSGNDAARAVAVDGAGELSVTGGFSGSAVFGGQGATQQLTSVGLDDLFVARYGPSGELRWVTAAGGAKSDRGLGIALNQAGEIYVTGFFTDEARVGENELAGAGFEILLARLDRDGRVVQTASAGGAGLDEGRGIAVAPSGTIFLTGRYQNVALFGTGANLRELRQRDRRSVTNIGAFVAAFDPSFKPVFLEGAGFEADGGEQSGNAIIVDAANRAHITGIVQQRSNLGIGSSIHSEPTAGVGDIFLASYSRGTPREVFYLSSSSGGTVDGIGFADEDVLAYDPANNTWSVLIDGSDIGLAATDIDGFEWRPDGSQLMSFDTPITLPEIPFPVDDSDIVRFIPSRLGATTQGRFEFFFDGSDVGLDDDSEDIDAIGMRADGRLVISTGGAARVPGARGEVMALDADLLLFSGDRLGEATRGSWERLFEGARSSLDGPDEGLGALWFQPDGAFALGLNTVLRTAGEVIGDSAEIWQCEPFTSDTGLVCGYSPFFDGAAKGMRGESIDAFGVGESGVLGDIGDGDDTEAGPDEDADDGGDGHRVYLPLLSR